MNEENKSASEHTASNGENKEIHSNSSEEVTEPIAEILKDVPPENRKHVEKTLQTTIEMVGGRLSPEFSVAKKITSEHISKYLDDSGTNMKLGYKERHQNKIFIFSLVVVALIFFLALILLLRDKPDLLENIIYTVGGFVAGAFGGYGMGKHKGHNDNS